MNHSEYISFLPQTVNTYSYDFILRSTS